MTVLASSVTPPETGAPVSATGLRVLEFDRGAPSCCDWGARPIPLDRSERDAYGVSPMGIPQRSAWEC
jgi:hypothetical protein